MPLDKVLHKRFKVMHCSGKPKTGPMIIEKAKYFYDEIKITDKCAFSEGSKKNHL
jgi:hypothetical protein